jgi:hypothetical protein
LLCLIFLALACIFAACDRQPDPGVPMNNAVVRADLQTVARMQVAFAHQSVGNDILHGVADLAAEHDVDLGINETANFVSTGAGISHFLVGRNGDPEGKLSHYVATLSSSADPRIDVALVKLCYVDFKPETAAAALADRYIQSLDSLQARYPQTIFAAITAPLTTVQSGPKAWVKKLLGRSPAGYLENRRREEFNDILRRHFGPDRLFDLAAIEASSGIGEEQSSPRSLDPRMTNDGGHLNPEGRRIVAAAFVRFLANAAAAGNEYR